MAARREKGFYSTLSSVSSVDILPSFGRKIGRKTRGQFYEVDRLINKRGKGNETEYLVKWKGYSPYESTWEPKENISTDCLRYFENPRPPVDVVFEEVSRLQAAIDRRL
ncbi:heterochromatin protein 1-like [Montipora capricornis]|uniref:heterochromatin protein 1-like n=1 Tax=Montipora capricornis TaxID=246305 RepID=UPI0035F1572E